MIAAPKPLVVQSDGTLLLEVHHPSAPALRAELSAIAHLEKSPEYFHEYQLTPISLWNAAQAGWTTERVLGLLEAHSRYPIPAALQKKVVDALESFGRIHLERNGETLILRATRSADTLLDELASRRTLEPFLGHRREDGSYEIDPEARGALKVAMIRAGYPVADRAGFKQGAHLALGLRIGALPEEGFCLRPYQAAAIDSFFSDEGGGGGSGVVVLPCGSGKTVVGIGVLARLKAEALILTPNITALRQWRRELLEKTDIAPARVAEYSGQEKGIAPITIATYQIMAHRQSREADFSHLELFARHDWGLIIYDEVHLLPAPVFRFTAEIQARRRLGLTATLVREDGRESEVFTLIGPRIYDLPWRELETDGFIAPVRCIEMRTDLAAESRADYAAANRRFRFRLAAENRVKLDRLKRLLGRHKGERILIIGQYLRQLRRVAREIGAPIITGQTPQGERETLYESFRNGGLPVLIVSKVGNFAVDLPDASVAIQISGTFGSRQEEAQRLGRILRPKSDGRSAFFYSIVTRDSVDQEFAAKRQRFLMEQGYQYEVEEPDFTR